MAKPIETRMLVGVRLPEPLVLKMKRHGLANELSLQAIVETAVRRYLAKG